LSAKQNTSVVYAVQGEKNARKIRFDLFNNGVKWVIDTTASVLISYKKPDGNGGMYDVLDNGESAFELAEDSTNSVIITLAEQVLTTVGAVSLLVSFVLDDEILSTFNIVLDVSENPGIDVAESEDYFSLSAAIDAAKKVVGEMLDPNAFASKKYVDGVIGDLRDDLDEIADDARVFYVTISKSDDGSFVADKSVEVIHAAYDNGRTVKAVVDDDGEQVIIPLIGIIEGDTVMYVGYGVNSNRIIISQTDILVSVHNDLLPSVKTVNGTAPDENGNVKLDIPSGGGGGSSSSGGAFRVEMTLEKDVLDCTIPLPVNWENILQFHIRMDNELYHIAADMKVYMICGKEWANLGTLAANTLVLDVYGISCQRGGDSRRLFSIGTDSSTIAADKCLPKFPATRALATSNSNILTLHSNTDGVLFPAGAHFEVWGVYAS
jgi:hypothetical protein